MTKKRYMIVAMLLATLLAAGCRKEQRSDSLTLVAEGARGGAAKLSIDGNYSDWASGDRVRINGTVAAVAIADGEASVAGSYEAPFYGIYPGDASPAGIYSSNDGDRYSVTLPSQYTYTQSGGRQNLQSPMAGYAASGNYILFRHLTAAIAVQITNYYGFDVLVDSVVVISNSYKLCGDLTFTLDGNALAVPAESKAGGDTVTMLGGGLRIASGNTATVQVPVLPQGEGNLFTVKVGVHKYNNADVSRVFESVQPSSHPLGRNQIGYVPMTVGYPFTVGTGKRVIIAQGNLQYQASTRTWQFAANQYDYIGNAAGNTTAEAERATQGAWIDLFGWGTSGWDNGNVYYQPYNITNNMPSSQGYGYGPTDGVKYNYGLVGTYAESDWGVHNKIANGGNTRGKWRVLGGGSGSEIDTLMSKRITVTSNMPTGGNGNEARFVKAMVGTPLVRGIIIFPDNYVHPDGLSISGTRTYNAIGNSALFNGFSVNANGWVKMEAAGAIFLPAAGYRLKTVVGEAGQEAYYWSSKNYNLAGAYIMKFLDGSASSYSANINRGTGCSVRLVQDIR